MIARGTCLESTTNNGSIFPTAGVLVEQGMFQVIAGTNQQMDTVQDYGKWKLGVAVAGKMIKQNSKLDEIQVDRALATVAQGLKVNRIGNELECDKQLNMECAVT